MRLEADRSVMAEINVTPLVDVMLVLLVIFMVTAPLMQQSVEVVLPKAKTGQHSGAGDGGLAITLTKDHLVYLDDRLVTMKELRGLLARSGGGKPVMIRADRHAYVDRLMELWDMCRDAGFRQVHIATLPD
jgi:biopolymer transport protein ExbD